MEQVTRISGTQIKEVIDQGPEKAMETVKNFVNNVKGLVECIQNLYEEHRVLFAFMGVHVKLEVECGGGKLLKVELGSSLEEEEESNGNDSSTD